MTSPANSEVKAGRRTYTFQGQEFISVTSVLKVIHSDALAGWLVKVTAERAVEMADDLSALVKADRDGALRTLKAARWVKTAAELGSLVHACVDAYSKGEPMPTYTPEAAPYIRSFLMFADDHQPEFMFNEATVYNRELGFAGTCDWLGHIDNKPALAVGDWKTGKAVYPDVALQLSAYAHGEFIDQAGAELPMPQVEEAYAIRLGRAEYELIPVKLSSEAWNSFRAALELTRWKETHEKFALGAK